MPIASKSNQNKGVNLSAFVDLVGKDKKKQKVREHSNVDSLLYIPRDFPFADFSSGIFSVNEFDDAPLRFYHSMFVESLKFFPISLNSSTSRKVV